MTFLDPRWEWIEVGNWGDSVSIWVKGRCLHQDVIPVESVTGELVAHLCLTCDQQLPGGNS